MTDESDFPENWIHPVIPAQTERAQRSGGGFPSAISKAKAPKGKVKSEQ